MHYQSLGLVADFLPLIIKFDACSGQALGKAPAAKLKQVKWEKVWVVFIKHAVFCY